jgi:hypothetical protein
MHPDNFFSGEEKLPRHRQPRPLEPPAIRIFSPKLISVNFRNTVSEKPFASDPTNG